jgi:iron complex outermembrane receptor protein
MWSQEFRVESSFDGAVNFSAGVYYADIEQAFETGQNAFNSGLLYPDPFTGNRYDWDKNQYTDTESISAFAAIYWDLSDTVSVTAGVRYSEDEKDSWFEIPYMHDFGSRVVGFLPSGTVVEDLNFEDDEITPEVAVNWAYSDETNFYLAYKSGYKSGGIDFSALPSASLAPDENGEIDVEQLYYDSETGSGVEGGVKSTLADGTLRLNGTIFYYVYEDLQVQLFDASITQYATFNAGELTTQGAEFDVTWLTPVEGLQLNAAFAYTDAEFTDEFINEQGDDLDGEPAARTADWTGFAGFTYDIPMGANWMFGLTGDARFNDGYKLTDSIDSPEQDSFWQYDASARFYSADGRYELAIIGRNLGDEVVAYSAQARPFSCTDLPDGSCTTAVPAGQKDQVLTSSIGRQYTVQFTFRY